MVWLLILFTSKKTGNIFQNNPNGLTKRNVKGKSECVRMSDVFLMPVMRETVLQLCDRLTQRANDTVCLPQASCCG